MCGCTLVKAEEKSANKSLISRVLGFSEFWLFHNPAGLIRKLQWVEFGIEQREKTFPLKPSPQFSSPETSVHQVCLVSLIGPWICKFWHKNYGGLWRNYSFPSFPFQSVRPQGWRLFTFTLLLSVKRLHSVTTSSPSSVHLSSMCVELCVWPPLLLPSLTTEIHKDINMEPLTESAALSRLSSLKQELQKASRAHETNSNLMLWCTDTRWGSGAADGRQFYSRHKEELRLCAAADDSDTCFCFFFLLLFIIPAHVELKATHSITEMRSALLENSCVVRTGAERKRWVTSLEMLMR